MGGGSYDYIQAHKRSVSYSTQSQAEVFTQHFKDSQMDIAGKIRESCDSAEHPCSFPIIIALDVTGSMTEIPERLIKGVFPDIMQCIAEAGVQHAQVCFLAFGDHYSDQAPLQVGQFETSDSLLDKWLKLIWLEGRGGGNGGESALLAYYFASRHTKCDHILKRHQKGVLITISDECTHRALDRGSVRLIFNDSLETEQITVEELIDEVAHDWDIYHYSLRDFSSRVQHAEEHWSNLLKGKGTALWFDDVDDLKNSIPKEIVKTYSKFFETSKDTGNVATSASATIDPIDLLNTIDPSGNPNPHITL